MNSPRIYTPLAAARRGTRGTAYRVQSIFRYSPRDVIGHFKRVLHMLADNMRCDRGMNDLNT